MTLASSILIALFALAIIAFLVFFYWQAKVILTLTHHQGSLSHSVAQNSVSNAELFRLFLSGAIHRPLRKKWSISVVWVIVAFAVLFSGMALNVKHCWFPMSVAGKGNLKTPVCIRLSDGTIQKAG